MMVSSSIIYKNGNGRENFIKIYLSYLFEKYILKQENQNIIQ
jgi:hypothetical protein